MTEETFQHKLAMAMASNAPEAEKEVYIAKLKKQHRPSVVEAREQLFESAADISDMQDQE